jgi:hypothetical protein
MSVSAGTNAFDERYLIRYSRSKSDFYDYSNHVPLDVNKLSPRSVARLAELIEAFASE